MNPDLNAESVCPNDGVNWTCEHVREPAHHAEYVAVRKELVARLIPRLWSLSLSDYDQAANDARTLEELLTEDLDDGWMGEPSGLGNGAER